VPARHQRRAVGDAPRGGIALLEHRGVVDHAVHEALLEGFLGIEHAALEHDLERGRAAD
jgi:hypothetical protein